MKHEDADFPIQYFVDELSRYPNQQLPLHWHLKLELYVAYGGTVEIQRENTMIRVAEGLTKLLISVVFRQQVSFGKYSAEKRE